MKTSEELLAALRDTPCPDGHGGRLGCITQGLAGDVERAGYFCAARIRALASPGEPTRGTYPRCPTCGHPPMVPPTTIEYRGGCIDPCHAAAASPGERPVDTFCAAHGRHDCDDCHNTTPSTPGECGTCGESGGNGVLTAASNWRRCPSCTRETK